MNDNPHNKSILCPRCGYDLRGITQTWNENGACPLTGKCSECGLDFDWGLLFTESDHSWFFENSIPNHQVRRFIRTILMTYRPWRFWREIEMTDRIDFRRLIRIPLFLLLVLYLFRLIAVCWSYQINIGFAFPNNLWNLLQSVNWFLISWCQGIFGFWRSQVVAEFSTAIGTPFFWTIAMIISFSLLPFSIRRAKVSYQNLVRVGIYTFVPIVPYLLVWAVLDLVFIGWHALAVSSPPVNLRFASMVGLEVVPSLGWFVWQVTCWALACKRYLKLPHAFLTAFLLTILSGLIVGLLDLWMS